MWLLIACLSIGVVVLSGDPAWAAKLRVLANGQVLGPVVGEVDATVPVNGELRGPDADATVTAVAWPYEADDYVADTGDRLVAFTVEMTEWASPHSPTLDLLVDGSPESLDMSSFTSGDNLNAGTSASGTESYVASVPNATHQIDLVLTDGTLTQSFSLWSLTRAPGAPAILYEEPTGSSVTEQLGVVRNVSIHDGSGLTYTEQVQATSAALMAFDPDGTGTVAPSNYVYLKLGMSGDVDSAQHDTTGNYFASITPIPGSDVIFTSSSGRRYKAQRSGVNGYLGDGATSYDDGMLDATYAFLVPADARRGIVTIEPSTTTGSAYLGYNGDSDEPIYISGPVRFSIGFPRAPVVARQPTPPWYGEPNPPTGLPSESRGASSGLPVGGAVAMLVLVIGVILVLRRRLAAKQEDETGDESVPASQPVEVAPLSEVARSDVGTMRVGFMGSVRVTPVNEPLSEFGRSLVCFLAVHDDRPRSVDDAQTALWPTVGTESDISRKTFLNYVSEVRRVVGTTHFPENSRRAGYRLVQVSTDWHEFRRLEAVVARSSGLARREAWVAALTLVRGVPFESELSRWFQWTDSEGLRTAITTAVVRMAVDAHAECVQTDDLAGAEWALRQGLRCNPGEFTVWACLADVVQARGDQNALERYWRDATASLDPGSVATLRDRVRG